MRTLARLEELGLVARVQREKMQTTVYELPIKTEQVFGPKKGRHAPRGTESLGAQSTRSRGTESLEVGAQCPTEPSPLNRKEPSGGWDKKNRSEKKPNSTARKTQLSASFEPDATCRQKAATLQVDVDTELEKFRNHAEANGRTAKNWQAAFRNWLIKAAELRGVNGRGQKRADAGMPWDGAR